MIWMNPIGMKNIFLQTYTIPQIYIFFISASILKTIRIFYLNLAKHVLVERKINCRKIHHLIHTSKILTA